MNTESLYSLLLLLYREKVKHGLIRVNPLKLNVQNIKFRGCEVCPIKYVLLLDLKFAIREAMTILGIVHYKWDCQIS